MFLNSFGFVPVTYTEQFWSEKRGLELSATMAIAELRIKIQHL